MNHIKLTMIIGIVIFANSLSTAMAQEGWYKTPNSSTNAIRLELAPAADNNSKALMVTRHFRKLNVELDIVTDSSIITKRKKIGHKVIRYKVRLIENSMIEVSGEWTDNEQDAAAGKWKVISKSTNEEMGSEEYEIMKNSFLGLTPVRVLFKRWEYSGR